MVSMKDIAARCGVSVATVSKALNDQQDVGAKTKEKVNKIAKEMGYFPNSSARALKTNRSYNLGVLFVDEARSGLRHDYFSAILEAFKVKAESCGYDITFINCNQINDKAMTYLEHCRYRGLDGVVIACVDFDRPEVKELIDSDVPVVVIDHDYDNRVSIISDNVTGMRELTEYIHSQGHERIAYIHGADSSVTRNRLGSFCRTMDTLGLKLPEDYLLTAEYRKPEQSYEATKKLLALKNPPTCIIYPDDYACIGGINAILEAGLMIPQDISVAGYDGIEIAKVLQPKITTLEQDTEKMGMEAAERLIELIEKLNYALAERVLIKGRVLIGNSVGKL